MTDNGQSGIAYLLRVEGVNLANVIDDTDQLSVRRGGGLMILNVATELKELLPQEVGDRLTPIATGASIGLFEFEAIGDDEEQQQRDAERVRHAVEKLLKSGNLTFRKLLKDHKFEEKERPMPLCHGTFVVDVVPVAAAPDVQQAEQLAVARNRWRQLQQPTLSLDGLWDEGEKEPCDLDRTRVGASRETLNKDRKDVSVSASAFGRWQYGRGARQQFYQRELGSLAKADQKLAEILNDAWFTDDLKALSGRAATDANKDTIPENLLDKIAIFYVDGNKFGRRGRDIFRTHGPDGFREWSTSLREHHRKLLADLLTLAAGSPHTWKNGDEFRIETLLWGGDEIVWVIPAWQGWNVAQWFFAQPHAVQVAGKKEELTYACGLVFCHAKAPIKNTSALAHKLGDLAKAARPGKHGLAYEVLESFDDVSGDLEEHRRRFLPPGKLLSELVLDPTMLSKCWDELIQLGKCHDLPMRQLYRLCAAWRRGEGYGAEEGRLQKACTDSGIHIEKVVNAFGDPVAWLHLLQMLPYLPSDHSAAPPAAAASTEGQQP